MIIIPLLYIKVWLNFLVLKLFGLIACYPKKDSLENIKGLFQIPSVSRGFPYPWSIALDHMGHAWYLTIMEYPRYWFGLSRGFKDIPVVGSLSITYHASLGPLSYYRIETKLLGFDTRWFYFKQVVINRRGRICTTMISKTKIVRKGKNPRPTPAEYLKEIGYGDITSPVFPMPTFPEVKKE